MRSLLQCCVFAALAAGVCSQEATGDFPEQFLEENGGVLAPAASEHYNMFTAGVPKTAVTVHPAAAPASTLVPSNVPPSGVIMANGPGNIQSYQVPGVGMTLGAGKKIPFIFINNVAAGASSDATLPASEQAEMNRLCVNTMGPGFMYSPARHLCEPAATAAAIV